MKQKENIAPQEGDEEYRPLYIEQTDEYQFSSDDDSEYLYDDSLTLQETAMLPRSNVYKDDMVVSRPNEVIDDPTHPKRDPSEIHLNASVDNLKPVNGLYIDEKMFTGLSDSQKREISMSTSVQQIYLQAVRKPPPIWKEGVSVYDYMAKLFYEINNNPN